MRLLRLIEKQAADCGELGSPLYEMLLTYVARDVRAGGVCATALAGYEDRPGSDVVALRLLGAVHSLVLSGRAPDLAAYYPSVGGAFDADTDGDASFAALAATLAAHAAFVRDWLTRPPQTNEVGRSGPLVVGLLWALSAWAASTGRRRPIAVRLFELGASAGLNLRADHFRLHCDAASWGDPVSPVRIEPWWHGAVPSWLARSAADHSVADAVTIIERRGCDLHPIDPTTPAGALAVQAYVWADQVNRMTRLVAATGIAARVPAIIEPIDAAAYLGSVELADDTLTVVWHSVMRQYLDHSQRTTMDSELARLARSSGDGAGFAHIAFEPQRTAQGHRCLVTVRVGNGPDIVVAQAPAHGPTARSAMVDS